MNPEEDAVILDATIDAHATTALNSEALPPPPPRAEDIPTPSSSPLPQEANELLENLVSLLQQHNDTLERVERNQSRIRGVAHLNKASGVSSVLANRHKDRDVLHNSSNLGHDERSHPRIHHDKPAEHQIAKGHPYRYNCLNDSLVREVKRCHITPKTGDHKPHTETLHNEAHKCTIGEH